MPTTSPASVAAGFPTAGATSSSARSSPPSPLLAATIALQVLLGLGPARAPLVDTLLTLLLAAPALLDWGLSRLRARGRNRYRLISGALLGVALGRSLWLYFRDPLSEIFWTQIALLVFGALAFELVRTLRLDD